MIFLMKLARYLDPKDRRTFLCLGWEALRGEAEALLVQLDVMIRPED